MLTVRAYLSPISSLVEPTGVTRHASEMLRQLCESSRAVDMSLLVNQVAFSKVATLLPPHIATIPRVHMAGPEGLMRRILCATKLARADSGLTSDAWLYSPSLFPVFCRNARLAVTVHDTLSHEDASLRDVGTDTTRRRKRYLLEKSLQRADLVCVVSNYLKERVLELYPCTKKHKIVVVGNAASSDFFEPMDQAEVDSTSRRFGLADRPFLLACGPLLYRKGADILIYLAKKLKSQGSNIRLALAGQQHDPQFEAEARAIGATFAFLDYVPVESLSLLMKNARALVLPSRCESFGIPAVEAMAAGTPVICSSIPALQEVVGDAGRCVPLESPEEFVRQALEVVSSQSLRDRLIALGHQRAKHFTWDKCADRLETALLGGYRNP